LKEHQSGLVKDIFRMFAGNMARRITLRIIAV